MTFRKRTIGIKSSQGLEMGLDKGIWGCDETVLGLDSSSGNLTKCICQNSQNTKKGKFY